MGRVFQKTYRGKDGTLRKCRTFHIRYNVDGVRKEEATEYTSERAAKKLLRLREGDIEHGVGVDPRWFRLTFDDAIKAVIDDYECNGRKSLPDVRRRITKDLTPAFSGKRMTAITTVTIREYRATRQAAGMAPTTVNLELAILRRAFMLAKKANQVASVPHFEMASAKNRARKGFFEVGQFTALLGTLPDYLKPVARFAYITGWRVPSEVLPLTWDRVDQDAGVVMLEVGTTKNGEARTFPLTLDVKAIIDDQAAARKARAKVGSYVFVDANGDPLFSTTKHGKRVARKPFYRDWKKACKAAGIPGRIPHDCRRTAVRNLSRAGVSDKIAMELSGHNSRTVFDRYNIVNEQDLKNAADRLPRLPTVPTVPLTVPFPTGSGSIPQDPAGSADAENGQNSTKIA